MGEVVQSVDRALSILEILSNNPDGMGIKEISEGVSLHKSTVHRLLATLIEKKYVKQNHKTNKYMLTFKMFEIGNRMANSINLVDVAKPYLKELVDITGEVVHLVVRDGNEIIYIDKIEPNNTLRMYSRIGKRIQMYCTAVGKSMMAYMDDSEIKEIWNNSDVKQITPKSIVDFDKYMKIINDVRKEGYALDEEENEIGIRCIGASILDYKNEVCAAISISGPTNIFTLEKIDTYSKLIKEVAEKISEEIGHSCKK